MASKLPLKIDSTNGIVRNFESGDFTALSAGGTNADLSATGGTSQVLKQSSAGAAITVGTLTVAEGGTGQTSWTKGDLLVTPGGTTLNKLAVGTDGYVLTADAASTNGVKWAAASGGGSLTGSGTTGKIPKWSGSTALGDSLLTESGTVVTAAASLAFTAVAAASASAYWAGAVTGSLVYNVPTGSFHAITVNNATVAAVNATGLCGVLGATGKVLVDGNLNLRSTSVGAASEYYVGRNSALVYNVPTGIDHVFAVNNNTVANLNSSGLMVGTTGASPARRLEVRSTSAQIRASYDGSNYQEIAVSSGGQLKISGAGTYATVIQIGTGSSVAAATDHQINIGTGTTTASESVAIGRTPTAAGGTVAIGYNANGSTYTNGTIVGRTASIGANSSVAIGSAASAGTGGNPAVAIGQDTVAVGDSVAISRSATTTAAGQFVCGSGNPAITDVYFNKGVVHATPTAWTLNGTGGSGTDIAGGKLQLAGGKPTGSGVGGSVVIQTAPAGTTGTTLRSLSDRLTVDHLGNIYPGTGALSTSATDGHFYIPTCAGTPTGVPTSFTGRCAIIMDTTNHKLYVYDGGWVAMN